MNFRIVNMTALLDAPNGQQIDVLTPNEQVSGTGQVSGNFTEVVISSGTKGWILTADASPIGAGEARPDLNIGDFVGQCVSVEAAFNALPDTPPWYVSADFLIARAIIETDLKNAGPKIAGANAVGPLQVSSKEWGDFLASGSPLVDHFRPGDFDNPMHQVFGAACSMSRDAKDISALKTPAGLADRFVPSNLDVFHAHLANSAKAAAAILDAAKSDADKVKSLKDCLATVMSADDLTAFFAARAQFTGPANQPNTVAAFVQATETAFDAALKRAFDLIMQFVPEVLAQIQQGEAPWFDVAEKEKDAGIAEPNPRILTYFQPTDFRPLPTSTDTPWCGAFAAFCMEQSGNPTAKASIPKSAALAASWKNWGTPLPTKSSEVPTGAVVVLTPSEGTKGSGHVGFFAGYTADRKFVTLLGGNQHNQVKLSNFPVSSIATINWLDLQPAVSPGNIQPSATKISPEALNKIIEFEVTSPAHYEKALRAPEWPGSSSGVTVGIGYDVGQTEAATVKADWQGVIPDSMLNRLLETCGVTGRPAKARAEALRGVVDIPFAQASKVFNERVMPRWVAVVENRLPNVGQLNGDCLGMLVSLTFNRGSAGYNSSEPRFAEMAAIKAAMAAPDFAKIPGLFRAMKRLWPDVQGLRDRRDAEADFFAQGLAKMHAGG